MALWGCYLLSFQTGLRGGHLYIFGEIVPISTHTVQYNKQNIYKMSEAIKLNKYLLKGLDGKFKVYEGNITEASPGS